MTYQPVIPMSGYTGWRMLERTMERQQEAFNESAVIKHDIDYFAENIGKMETAEQLVSDYRLLKVALTAFGLQNDLPNKYFIQKALAEGTEDADAFANKLADKTYKKMADAFGFGNTGGARTGLDGFVEEISAAYQARSFELAVGEQNNDMRLAMNLDREVADLAASDISENAKWYSIMGSTPLRAVFDTAFGLSDAFAALDVDRQLEVYKEKAEAYFGSEDLSQFAEPEKRDELIKLFMIRSDMNSGISGYTPMHTALTILGG